MRVKSESAGWSHLVYLYVIFFCAGCCQGQIWDYVMKDYKDHPCVRPCSTADLPRLCKYEFLVENYYVLSRACHNCPFNQSDCLLPQCVSSDGLRRAIIVANRMMPGPSIQVCQGDTIEVAVDNALDSAEGTSIHWHGILQKGTPYMDGVSMVTQCPITYHSRFTYKFVAEDAGTYFWHGHSGSQRADGLYGSLIIRKPLDREPRPFQYIHDLPEHVIIVSDWIWEMSPGRVAKYVHYDYDNKPRLMLINGMGRYENYTDSYSRTFYTPYASFTVKKGEKYRFRLINSGIMNCALQFSIDNHKLTIIESDGSPVRELTVDSLTIYAGERFDFLLDAYSFLRRNFWIRVRGLGNCEVFKAKQTAILKYDDAPDMLPPEGTSWYDANRGGYIPCLTQDTSTSVCVKENLPEWRGNTNCEYIVHTAANSLNQASLNTSRGNFEITALESTAPDDETMAGKADKIFYMKIDFVQVENLRAYNPSLYPMNTSSLKFYSPQLNGISSQLPPSPPLTQLNDLPEEIFCNPQTVQKHCDLEWCACVQLYEVALGDLVEVVIVDEGTISHAYHPMHLHGHKFRVIGIGKLNESTTLEKVKQLDLLGRLNRTFTKAPIKDTVIVPDGGYTIFRFRADNPGFWLYHCHVEFHSETGMALVFQVGTPSQHPPKPKNFPTCGHWKFTGYEKTSPP